MSGRALLAARDLVLDETPGETRGDVSEPVETAATSAACQRRAQTGTKDPQQEPNARQAAEEAVAKVASELGGSRPPSVTVLAVSGFAAQELIDASRDGDLLVVGSRGGGGFARLVLGSITNKVMHHSACPAVVVPVDG